MNTKSINIGRISNPNNPPITEADEVMRLISSKLGGNWGTVKLGGIWLIWKELGSPLSGDAMKGQPLRRSFVRALADATGSEIVYSK